MARVTAPVSDCRALSRCESFSLFSKGEVTIGVGISASGLMLICRRGKSGRCQHFLSTKAESFIIMEKALRVLRDQEHPTFFYPET